MSRKTFSTGITKESSRVLLNERFQVVNLDTDLVITRTGAFGENVGIEVIIDFLISLPENVIFVLMGNLPDYFFCFTRDLVREFGLGSHVLITSYIGHAVHFRPPNYRDRLF